MFIARNLRRLRLNKGLTQEELAERVYVTGQAVSKWERDECHPDITLLPGLANLFEVTVDELLGMEEINDKDRIWNIHAQANSLQVQGKYHDAAAIYEQALKTFPSDIGLLTAHATTLAMAGEGTSHAIRICERALEENTSDKSRGATAAALCFLYRRASKLEKAEDLARSRPHARESRELLLPNFLKQPERDSYLREHIPGILAAICALIDGSTGTDEEQLRSILLGTSSEVFDPVDTINKISEFLNGYNENN